VQANAFERPAQLVDLAPTILAALGVPASVKHDGRVLSSVVGEEALAATTSGVAADVGVKSDSGLDAEEAREVEEHLRGLGYLE
jgi:arylsulfatase A-like enzyme